jgi:hypothetical protein
MPELSEWLQIMLAEIARKQEEALRCAEEEERRRSAPAPVPAPVPASEPTPQRIAAR